MQSIMNNTLVETSQIIQQLQCLFDQNPKICLKQNRSGWGTNQRIICVKNKKLFYAKLYNNFKQDQVLAQIPEKYIKAFVSLDQIYQVSYLPQNNLVKKTLAILIPESRIRTKGFYNYDNINTVKKANNTDNSVINMSRIQPKTISQSPYKNTIPKFKKQSNQNEFQDQQLDSAQNMNLPNQGMNYNNFLQSNTVYDNNLYNYSTSPQFNQSKNLQQTQNQPYNETNTLPARLQQQVLQQQAIEKQKMQKWIFHFNYDLRQKLRQMKIRKKQQQKKKNQLKFQNQSQLNNKSYDLAQQQQENQQIKNNHNKIYKFAQNQQRNLYDYVNQIKRAKQILKFKQNRQKMQKDQRKKLKQKSNNNNLNNNNNKDQLNNQNQQSNNNNSIVYADQENFLIQSHWRYYFIALQYLLNRKSSDKSVYQYQLQVYQQIHHFKTNCISLFKSYIYQKLNNINMQKFFYNGFYFYKGIWIKLGGKQLNQQFKMYYYVSDIVQILNKINLGKIKFYIPDMCFVQYLGYKALCMCDLPYTEFQRSQVYNIQVEGFDLHNSAKFKEYLQLIEKALNIKIQDFPKERKKIPAPLGHNIKIYQYNQKKDYKADQTNFQNFFYYIVNLENQFPLDFNKQIQKINYECRLRPELINQFRDVIANYEQDTCLLSTAFLNSFTLGQQQKAKEDDKVVRASDFLLKTKIPQFLHKLNQCQIILIDSYSIKMYFEQFGINIRYINKIHEYAKLSYICEILQIDCIGRIVKRLFNNTLKEIISTQFIQKNRSNSKYRNQNNSQIYQINANDLNNKIIQDQKKINFHTMDYLNLIFGNGNETDMFWKIIIKEIKDYFEIQIKYPFQGSSGCLLHSIMYHCGIQGIFDLDIPLFEYQKPFSSKNQICHKLKIKNFDFPSFQIQKVIKNYPSIEKLQNTSQNKQMIQEIAFKLFKMDLLKNYYLYEGQFNYQTSFTKINLIKQDMQIPNFTNSHHPSVISYYLTNKSQANFQKGMNLLQFSFSDFHPIYIAFYQEYSNFYQPQLLKKSAVLQSLKIFSEYHPKTAQLYSKFYNQGFKEYYEKSLRSDDISTARMSSDNLYKKKQYQSCMSFCLKQIKKSQQNHQRIQQQNVMDYLHILFMGMKSAVNIRHLKQSLLISRSISGVLNSFRIRQHKFHYEIIKQLLKGKLLTLPNKMFLYKMALLCITLQKRYQQKSDKIEQRSLLLTPASGKLKQQLSIGIMNEYFIFQTHQLWLDNIFNHLLQSIKYFNYLEDLFNNTQYHIQRYNNQSFKDSLGYYDILIRLYGQEMFKNYLYETGN